MEILYDIRHFSDALNALNAREAVLDYDSLGRTLAYSPFTSRIDSFEELKAKTSKQSVIIQPCELHKFIQCAQSLDSKDLITIDSFRIYKHIRAFDSQNDERLSDSVFEHLEFLSHTRRYTTNLILHKDIFLKPYQMIESALYGADCVLIDSVFVSGKELDSLLVMACKLRLLPIVLTRDTNELKKAIFAKARAVFLPKQNFEQLLSATPNSLLICSDFVSNSQALDIRFSFLMVN